MSATSFVGRERELSVLLGGLAALEDGRGSLFLLSGEPGIGKTRLADELAARARARGATVAWGAAWDGGGAPAFWPWIEVLRALRGSVPVPDERLRADLGPLWGERPGEDAGRDAELERFRRLDALRAVVQAAAARAPLVVVLDDLHAADRASLLALQFVARGLRSARVLLLGTHRDAEARLDAEVGELLARVARDATTLTLGRLAREDVARLVAELDPVTPALVDEVYAASGGNPLYVGESLRLVRSGARGREVPDRVSAIVGERLARLEPATRDALAAAAVIGLEVPWRVLAAVLGTSVADVGARLRSARLAGLVDEVGDDGVRFSHAVFRERLEADVSPGRRAALHLAAAGALERLGGLGIVGLEERVARHRLAALPAGDPGAAAAWATRAGERALRGLAFDRAVQLLERALDVLDTLPDDPARRVDVELRLADALARAGHAERARGLCAVAAARARACGDAVRLAEAALAYGAELRIGVVDRALIALLEEALAALGDAAPGLRARVLSRLAAAQQPAVDPAAPIRRAREAVALARTVGDPEALLWTVHTAGSALASYAAPQERLPLSRELVSLALVRGDLVLAQHGYARLAIDAAEMCDADEMERAIAAHERLGAALGAPRWRWRSALLRSMSALVEGRWDDAERAQAEAAALVAQVDDPGARLTLAIHRLGAFRAREAGALADAAAIARGAPDELASVGAMGEVSRASTMARFGELDGARRVLDSVPVSEVAALPSGRVLLADVAMRLGDRTRAAALLPAVAELGWPAMSWGAIGCIWEGPTAQWTGGLLAVLERWDEAVTALEEALALARAMRAAPLAAQLGCELARALAGRGAPDDVRRAAGLLEAAAGGADALALPFLAARVAAAREALGTVPPAAADARAAPDVHLTREGEIWCVTSGARSARLRHSRALELLDVLVKNPGREFHVLELGAGGAGVDRGDAGEALDAAARDAYRRRLRELDEELGEAEAWGDAGRSERLRAERDFLADELARSVGLGGRARREPGAVERARVNVQKRVRGAIRRIGDVLPEAGRHLEREVRTGVLVSYRRDG